MKDIHAKLVPADQEEKADTEAKATEQKSPAKKVSLKKEPVVKQEAPAKKAPAKKRGRPASKKAPAKKGTTANETPAKKVSLNKNTVKQEAEQLDPNQKAEQQKPDNRLDDILKLAQNNAEMISSLNRKVNKLDERMDNMTDQNPRTTPNEDKLKNGFDRFVNWLKADKKLPGWVLLLLVILLLILTLLLDGAMFANRKAEMVKAPTVVTAQHGSIAVNGNVTINVYQDRATAAEGTEVETSYTRPLVYLNYNGASDEADDSVVIDTTQDGTRDVTVGDSTVKVEAPN